MELSISLHIRKPESCSHLWLEVKISWKIPTYCIPEKIRSYSPSSRVYLRETFCEPHCLVFDSVWVMGSRSNLRLLCVTKKSFSCCFTYTMLNQFRCAFPPCIFDSLNSTRYPLSFHSRQIPPNMSQWHMSCDAWAFGPYDLCFVWSVGS